MLSMRRAILIILTAILIAATFFSSLFIKKNYLSAAVYFVTDYFKTDLRRENVSLKFENENLRAQLQKIQAFKLQSDSPKNYLESRVFSTYPFNVRDVLVIDKGSADGVKKGQAVVLKDNIFLGQVAGVSENSASIRTVFDPNWQLSVKIGENKINGLFDGGNDLKITLIEKPVRPGDAVFLASKDLPLDLKIGDIQSIKEDQGGIFKEAAVSVPYNVSELESVYLIR